MNSSINFIITLFENIVHSRPKDTPFGTKQCIEYPERLQICYNGHVNLVEGLDLNKNVNMNLTFHCSWPTAWRGANMLDKVTNKSFIEVNSFCHK